MVLAAGGSSRLGYAKQLIEYNGEPLVRRSAQTALDSGLLPVIVVVGAETERVQASVGGLSNVIVCFNQDWQTGLASSLRAGLAEAARSSADGVVVLAADQPHVSVDDLRRLATAFDEEHRLVASAYNGVVGVPAIFGREFFDELSKLRGDSGAGGWMRARLNSVRSIPLSSAAFDVDVERDVLKLMQDEPTK